MSADLAMSYGIATQFVRRFPNIRDALVSLRLRVGDVGQVRVRGADATPPRFIFNLVTKEKVCVRAFTRHTHTHTNSLTSPNSIGTSPRTNLYARASSASANCARNAASPGSPCRPLVAASTVCGGHRCRACCERCLRTRTCTSPCSNSSDQKHEDSHNLRHVVTRHSSHTSLVAGHTSSPTLARHPSHPSGFKRRALPPSTNIQTTNKHNNTHLLTR